MTSTNNNKQEMLLQISVRVEVDSGTAGISYRRVVKPEWGRWNWRIRRFPVAIIYSLRKFRK